MSALSRRMIPSGTHPAVVEEATGKRVKGSTAASTFLIEDMRADLETISAAEFRTRYLDFQKSK